MTQEKEWISWNSLKLKVFFSKDTANRMRKQATDWESIFTKGSSNAKGTCHAKIGSIKDRNGMDLTEAEDIKKRWQEYTEELYKKDLHDPDNHDGVITHTHLEPDPGMWSQVGLRNHHYEQS